ncbi:MrpH family fimbial adhesin [Pseudomonas sp. M5A4_2d]
MWCLKAGSQTGGIIIDRPQQKPLSCNLHGNLQIRHYELTSERVNNDRAFATAFVNCNRSAKVTLAIDKSIKLNGVEGLYSQLHIGYASAGEPYTVTINASDTAIRVNSTLNTQGTLTSGAFSGSTRLVMTFP